MIHCICIDDSDKPCDFPLSRWVKKGEEYHITWVTTSLPQNTLSYSLYEKPLDESCLPYQYFKANRFSIAPEDLEALFALFSIGNDLPDDEIKILFENSNAIETLNI